MKKTIVILTVLALCGMVQADAISVNLAGDGAGGTVSGSQTGADGTYSAWINVSGGHSANWAASADGSGWTSGTMDSSLSETGADLGSFSFTLYDGGWGANLIWNDGGQTANTTTRAGISNGEMPNNWGPTGLGLALAAVPFAEYDVWGLIGPTYNSGAGLTWTKLNTETITEAASGSFAFNTYTMRSMAAFQVLEVPEPATMSLLAIGGVAALLRRRRR